MKARVETTGRSRLRLGLNDAETVVKGNEFRKCSILQQDIEGRNTGRRPGEMAVNSCKHVVVDRQASKIEVCVYINRQAFARIKCQKSYVLTS